MVVLECVVKADVFEACDGLTSRVLGLFDSLEARISPKIWPFQVRTNRSFCRYTLQLDSLSDKAPML